MIIEFEEKYKKLRKRVKEGYFESLLKEIILENDYQAEIYLKPSEEILREKTEEEEENGEKQPDLSIEDLEQEERHHE